MNEKKIRINGWITSLRNSKRTLFNMQIWKHQKIQKESGASCGLADDTCRSDGPGDLQCF